MDIMSFRLEKIRIGNREKRKIIEEILKKGTEKKGK